MTDELTQILHTGHHSLVVAQGEDIRTFDGKGVSDLLTLLDKNGELLKEARVADKIVGKAAAGLMVCGGVKEVYADIICTPAIALLRKQGLAVSYGEEVDHIENRTHEGWCPLETACKNLSNAEDIKAAILHIINRNNIDKHSKS